MNTELMARVIQFVEECAMGTRLDPHGLNHDNDSLMELLGRARKGSGTACEQLDIQHALKERAYRAMALWTEINQRH